MNVAKRTIKPATTVSSDFSALLERLHAIGRETVAPHAESVDREARFPLEELPRCPHPDVAAAEDHDIGGAVAGERRGRVAGVFGEGLLEPPAAVRLAR